MVHTKGRKGVEQKRTPCTQRGGVLAHISTHAESPFYHSLLSVEITFISMLKTVTMIIFLSFKSFTVFFSMELLIGYLIILLIYHDTHSVKRKSYLQIRVLLMNTVSLLPIVLFTWYVLFVFAYDIQTLYSQKSTPRLFHKDMTIELLFGFINVGNILGEFTDLINLRSNGYCCRSFSGDSTGPGGHGSQKYSWLLLCPPQFSRRVQNFEFRMRCLLKIHRNEKDLQGMNIYF